MNKRNQIWPVGQTAFMENGGDPPELDSSKLNHFYGIDQIFAFGSSFAL
jgi:hypothetical protein